MKIYSAKDYQDMSRKAANILSAQVIMKPNCVLGLATGSTPIGTYEQLIKWYEKGDLDFADVKTINLDEYKGLSRNSEQSYYHFMHKHFFEHINIEKDNINIPNGLAKEDIRECARYNKCISDLGGIDIQLLGLGHNGHIGFNEPGAVFEKETHCIDLTDITIKANQRFFVDEEVPRQAYTMGIKNIMQARKILLVVSGEAKAEILYKALKGPVTPLVPASILQFHNDVTIVADEAALSQLL